MKKQIQSFLLMLMCLFTPASYAQEPAVVKVYLELGEVQERKTITFSPKKRQYIDVSIIAYKGNTVTQSVYTLPKVMKNNKLWEMWFSVHASDLQDKDSNKRYRVYPENLFESEDGPIYLSTANVFNQSPDQESMVVHYIFTFIYKGKKEVTIDWPIDLTVSSVEEKKPTTVVNRSKEGSVFTNDSHFCKFRHL